MNKVIVKINDLIDKHGDTFTQCKGCAICTEIKRLREQFSDRSPAEKLNHLLVKGQDMTKSDIELLLESGVDKVTIRKALNMGVGKFNAMMHTWGFKLKGERDEMAKLQMTAEEFVQLRFVDQKSMVQIGKIKGVSDVTIHNWKSKNMDAINDALSKRKTPYFKQEVVKPSKTITDDKTAEYKRIIGELKDRLEEKDLELKAKIAEKVREYENLHASHEDVENELHEVKKYNGEIEEKLRESFDKLRKAEQDIQWYKIELDKERRNARDAEEHRDDLRRVLKRELSGVIR